MIFTMRLQKRNGRAACLTRASLISTTFIASLAALSGPAAARPPAELSSRASADAVEVQTDGRIVVAGTRQPCSPQSGSCGNAEVVVSRYLADGSPDAAFGDGEGTIVIPGDAHHRVVGLASDPEGRIDVAAAGAGLVLIRLTASGDLDPTLGGDGVVGSDAILPTSSPGANALTVAPDGRLLVAGDSPSDPRDRLSVARFHPDGRLDSDFGSDGVASVAFSSDADEDAQALALRADGRILVVGGTGFSLDPGPAVVAAQFRPDGVPDASFGDDGGAIVTSDSLSMRTISMAATSISLRQDESAILAGRSIGDLTSHGNCSTFIASRISPTGTLDRSFGVDGRAARLNCGPSVVDAALQRDGRLVVGGSHFDYFRGAYLATARYTESGQPDPSFADETSLELLQIAGQSSFANSVALAPDGGILSVGSVSPRRACAGELFACSAMALVRQTPTGELDRAFGRGGIVTEPGVHLCPRTPRRPCGPNLGEPGFRKLLRDRFPASARLAGNQLRVPIACAYRIETRCRISVAAAPRKGQPKVAAGKRPVRAGRSRTLGLDVRPAWISRLSGKRRIFLRQTVRVSYHEAVSISGSVRVRAGSRSG